MYSVWGYENADLDMMKNSQFVTLTGKKNPQKSQMSLAAGS